MTALLAIPARWNSSRLPGKPLRPITGVPLLTRCVGLARRAAKGLTGIDIAVVTDDDRIEALAASLDCRVIRTDPAIGSGSARVLAAAELHPITPAVVVNLQGDAPFLPVAAVRNVLAALDDGAAVATPVTRLGWPELDALRDLKREAPFSGTTCIVDRNGEACWFSKQIIPAIRDEAEVRRAEPLSPVHRHLGLYGYTLDALKLFEAAPPSRYERLEGLEQLRFIDLGIPIRTVPVSADKISMSGIDTMADIAMAEALIAQHGDPYDDCR